MNRITKRFLRLSPRLCNAEIESRQKFIEDYRVRSTLARFIHSYAQKVLLQFSIEHLYKQSTSLDKDMIIINAKEAIE